MQFDKKFKVIMTFLKYTLKKYKQKFIQDEKKLKVVKLLAVKDSIVSWSKERLLCSYTEK